MKIWVKFILGSAVGMALGLLFPPSWASPESWLGFLVDLALRGLRWLLFPFLAVSLLVALYDLRRELRIGRVFRDLLLFGLLANFVLITLGSLVLALFPPQRIPILSRSESVPSLPAFVEIFRQALPRNVLQTLVSTELFLPFFSLIIALAFAIQQDKREQYLPVLNLADALSRLFYRLNGFLVEVFAVFSPFLMASMILQIRAVPELALYLQAGLLLTFVVLLATLGVFPLLLRLLNHRFNPYKVLFGNLGASLTALFTGDPWASLAPLVHLSRENLGVSRKIGALAYPFLSLFSRGGTALVSLIGFYVVMRSYSSLDITLEQYFWAILASFLVIFLLPVVPAPASYLSIVVLCQWYGKGMETAYLNLLPLVFWMSALAAYTDVTVTGLVAAYLAQREGVLRQIELKKFV